MRRAALVFAASLALLTPSALAGLDQCSEPFGPVVPTDASTVSKEQLRVLKAEVEQFIVDSDAFQTCLVTLLAITKKEDKLSPADRAKAQRKLDSNQREKQAIGDAYNALVKAINARGG